ncbi:MAG TPA: hypothetical protein DCG47_03280 [Spirochaetaceae bacterium]|nr:hypothetical protein [Spirochaetaceae bacterium]
MNYRKIDTPENFRFGEADKGPGIDCSAQSASVRIAGGHNPDVELSLSRIGPGSFRLRGESARWPEGSGSIAGLGFGENPGSADASESAEEARCVLRDDGGVDLWLDGTRLLKGAGFGLCGQKWMSRFEPDEYTRYYGLGGKNLGFELSGKRTIFWNSDLFAEFDWAEIAESRADPLYASFPVLIGRKARGDGEPPLWWAVVMDAPWPGFVNLGAGEGIFAAGSTPFRRWLYLGARGGAPDLWFFAERDPLPLLRSLQSLQGRMPAPPLWALGHQQCRWGYRSYEDLKRIADEYEARGIPNDGLWLDIDYMDGFRVFTVDPAHFDDTAARVAELKARGYAVVPILDPGLRRDSGYRAYREAKERGALCVGGEGQDYTGFVWPGYAVFPDFATEEGRAFWAEEVAAFCKLGFSGYWIDMNDPSAGSAPLEDMRFKRGELDHEAFHNQYALGMAMATRSGLERARPDSRPFLISRSGYLGMARHAGMWTGDNVSNAKHLAAIVAFSLNLSLSGMPLNGPDVPGFAGDADGALMEAWYKAGFLFPFLRNHNVAGAKDQEPWTRGARTERVVGDYIRSRYKLLPYLYQCWIAQEERGDPVMRPLWLGWPAEEWTSLCGDQFMVGEALLHAPILEPGSKSRVLRLPGCRWFDWCAGAFIDGGATIASEPGRAGTPLYMREGYGIPLLKGRRSANGKDLRIVDLALFVEARPVAEGAEQERYGSLAYMADDGESLAYRRGERSGLILRYAAEGGLLSVEAEGLKNGYGSIRFRILVPEAGGVKKLRVNGRERALKPIRVELAGRKHAFLASATLGSAALPRA